MVSILYSTIELKPFKIMYFDFLTLRSLHSDTEYGGYQCNESTVHLQCQACGGMMPSRSNVGVQQHCKYYTSKPFVIMFLLENI